jgi:hypothetical protein
MSCSLSPKRSRSPHHSRAHRGAPGSPRYRRNWNLYVWLPQWRSLSQDVHLRKSTRDVHPAKHGSSHPVARCGCHRMKLGSTSPTLSPPAVTVTTPDVRVPPDRCSRAKPLRDRVRASVSTPMQRPPKINYKGVRWFTPSRDQPAYLCADREQPS